MQNMQMEIRYSPRFRKQYVKSNKKVKIAFNSRLELFLQNAHHPLLKNHSLTGEFKGYRSINITGDWRAIYLERRDAVIFITLGTHSQLYK